MRTKAHFWHGQREGEGPRCSHGHKPQALAFVRRQKTLSWSKHHLSLTFRFRDCFTHSKTFALFFAGFCSTPKVVYGVLILGYWPSLSLLRWLNEKHISRVLPGLGMWFGGYTFFQGGYTIFCGWAFIFVGGHRFFLERVYIFSRPYFAFPASFQQEIDTARVNMAPICDINIY